MAQPYRKSAVYGSLAYDLDALVRERQLEDAGKLPQKQPAPPPPAPLLWWLSAPWCCWPWWWY